MSQGFQRGFATLLIIAVAMASNLHLPLVQAVAWTRMYMQYREQFAPEAALKITFSGEYPCPLCKVVQAAETERNNAASLINPTERMLLLPLPKLAAFAIGQLAGLCGNWLEPPLRLTTGDEQPATPPPRAA